MVGLFDVSKTLFMYVLIQCTHMEAECFKIFPWQPGKHKLIPPIGALSENTTSVEGHVAGGTPL
jgi:hypothetical protein